MSAVGAWLYTHVFMCSPYGVFAVAVGLIETVGCAMFLSQ